MLSAQDDINRMIDDPSFREQVSSSRAEMPTIIKAIGVGGGGTNAINHMHSQGIKNVSFVVCNTDKQALMNSAVQTRVLLGPNTTHGLGAGNDPEKAREAAEESAAEINALFNDETKMVFITAGMGGGTGTGAAPVVARLAKEKGLLTIGIVTIPFLFEGESKINKALDGADEMAKYVDALLVINNERLTEIYPDFDFLNAFCKADDTLSTAAKSIAEIITCEGRINLDFNDVNTTLRGGGAAIISCGYGEGENRVTKAIEDALNSPLLKNRDIYGSKKLLFNLCFSPNAENRFLMSEASELTKFMSNIDPKVDVIWGLALDDTLGDQVKITILAAGFNVTIRNDEDSSSVQPITYTPNKTTSQRISDEYGNQMDVIKGQNIRQKYAVLTPGQFDDEAVIELVERTPAFNRSKEVKERIKNTNLNTPLKPIKPQKENPDNVIEF